MPQTFQFRVENPAYKLRLDSFLYDQIGFVSRMFLKNLLNENQVFVNGAIQRGGYHPQHGDEIRLTFDETTLTAMTPENLALDIVFEDDEIIVVNKPTGMLVHPTKSQKTNTLMNGLSFHLNNLQSAIRNPQLIRPVLVHRLDRATSGLMLVAKTAHAARILSIHFEKKLVKKTYLAVVEGVMTTDSGTIDAPIGRFEELRQWNVDADGKPAQSNFNVLERFAENTLLELEPVTGRTNQLRIHCAHIGFPIVGDEWYGAQPFARLCLHAAQLKFYHPNGGAEQIELRAAAPPEFDDFRQSLANFKSHADGARGFGTIADGN